MCCLVEAWGGSGGGRAAVIIAKKVCVPPFAPRVGGSSGTPGNLVTVFYSGIELRSPATAAPLPQTLASPAPAVGEVNLGSAGGREDQPRKSSSPRGICTLLSPVLI